MIEANSRRRWYTSDKTESALTSWFRKLFRLVRAFRRIAQTPEIQSVSSIRNDCVQDKIFFPGQEVG